MNGYAGQILKVNLTRRKTSTIPTAGYEQWVGGHGMGSAIFFDLVKDKAIDGFDPANVVTLMSSPLSGTLTPAGAARTEIQGIGVQSVPIGWFTRSNFGGRFSSMLKFAGWDGIVIEGQVFGKSSIKVHPVAQRVDGDIQQLGQLLGGRLDARPATLVPAEFEGGSGRTDGNGLLGGRGRRRMTPPFGSSMSSPNM